MGAPEGNANRANQYRIKRTLESVLQRRTETRADGIDALEKACEAILDKAEAGDVQAFREIADRLEGKALQRNELSGPDGAEIRTGLKVEFVGPVPS